MFWATLELLSNYLPEIGLTGVYAVAILTFIGFCSDRIRQRKNQQNAIDSDYQIGRRLGLFESMIDDLHSYGGALQSVVLLLKSKVSLQQTMVRQTLERLPRKHTILRMRVREVAVHGRTKAVKCFIEMDEPYAIDFYIKSKQARNWESSFEKELSTPFQISDGPLWRARLFKEEYHAKERCFLNTLLFSVHQLIADDTALLNLCGDFLDFLNMESGKVDNDIKTTSVPLYPPISDLLKHHITLTQLDKVLLSLKPIFARLLYKIVGKPRNQFTAVIPPTSLCDPTILRKTCILPRNLPKCSISELVEKCKENKCTVHGMLTAAASVAIATMLQNGDLRIPMSIPLSFSVNVRQECQPPISSKDLGCFTLDCGLKIPVPVLQDIHEHFWKFAQKCTQQVRQAVASGKHHACLKELHLLDIDFAKKMYKVSKNKKTAGRLNRLCHVSNLGKQTFGKEGETKAYECNGVYFAGAGHNFGPVFSNNLVTIDGQLFWSIIYYSNVVTQDVATEYAELVFKTLKDVV